MRDAEQECGHERSFVAGGRGSAARLIVVKELIGLLLYISQHRHVSQLDLLPDLLGVEALDQELRQHAERLWFVFLGSVKERLGGMSAGLQDSAVSLCAREICWIQRDLRPSSSIR